MEEELRKRIEELAHEQIDIVPYDGRWPAMFDVEARFLSSVLPLDLVSRIEHIGSTAVPGLSAKPIIDVQVEVSSLDRTREEIAPILSKLGYEYIWRPTIGEHAPNYAWFIKRNKQGDRTHHLHVVEPDQASVDRILFRDYLRRFPEAARAYELLKRHLALRYHHDRVAYARNKTDHIASVVQLARELAATSASIR